MEKSPPDKRVLTDTKMALPKFGWLCRNMMKKSLGRLAGGKDHNKTRESALELSSEKNIRIECVTRRGQIEAIKSVCKGSAKAHGQEPQGLCLAWGEDRACLM